MKRSARRWHEWQRGTLGLALRIATEGIEPGGRLRGVAGQAADLEVLAWLRMRTVVLAMCAVSVPDERGDRGHDDHDCNTRPQRPLDSPDRRREQVAAERH